MSKRATNHCTICNAKVYGNAAIHFPSYRFASRTARFAISPFLLIGRMLNDNLERNALHSGVYNSCLPT